MQHGVLLRRSGIHSHNVDPGSAAHHVAKYDALRSIQGTELYPSYPARSGSVTGAPIRIECSIASVASRVARASLGVASVQGRPVAR